MHYTKEELSYNEIANRYNVHRDTIEDINNGISWHDSHINYPIRKTTKKSKQFCLDCGKELSTTTQNSLCKMCFNKSRAKSVDILPVSRDKLKDLIRKHSFLSIGKMFNVSDNTIRKWCKKHNLPSKVSDIKKISDYEWMCL